AHTCLSGCHSSDKAEGELDLETAPVRERLIGKHGSEGDACDPYVLIDPDAPDQSLMYLKLGGEGPPPCGNTMPFFGHPPGQRRLECMLEWITGEVSEPETP